MMPSSHPRQIRPGLLSVTFRQSSARDIIRLADQAGLAGIEWGGDIHVPTKDLSLAAAIGEETRAADLAVEAYGSYYRAGWTDPNHDLQDVIATASALGAPRIRIWAGREGSREMALEQRARVVRAIDAAARQAADAGITVALEFHRNTLTDSIASTVQLMEEIGNPAVRLYWQPPAGMPCAEALAGLERLLPWVDNVHVFHWESADGQTVRKPLAEGKDAWALYLEALEGKPRWALLEFVRNDDPAQFSADAEELRRWLQPL